ncbi:reverse transcriptase domain-containing protein, partial [Tanacetum coccineum]
DSRIEWWKAMEEARVMTRGFEDLVAKLEKKVVMEVLVRCWSDGDVVMRSMPPKRMSTSEAPAMTQAAIRKLVADSKRMPPKRMSTSKAPADSQAVIRKLVADSVFAALEAQAANMENTNNTTRPREAHVARQCSYKEFMRCQPINFKDCKVKFATGTLTKEALSWWNSFAQPIGIEEAYKITWVEFKKLLIKKYCPQTEVQKMEDEFYHLTVKGNDLKAYVRRFQELTTLCPTMVQDSEKMIEVFIRGLPRSIEGNVTASKPQTLEEAINIAQRLMDQVTKHTPVQVSSDHKLKFAGLMLSL